MSGVEFGTQRSRLVYRKCKTSGVELLCMSRRMRWVFVGSCSDAQVMVLVLGFEHVSDGQRRELARILLARARLFEPGGNDDSHWAFFLVSFPSVLEVAEGGSAREGLGTRRRWSVNNPIFLELVDITAEELA